MAATTERENGMEVTPESNDLVQRKSATDGPVTQRKNGRSRAKNDPLYLAHDHTGRRQSWARMPPLILHL